MTPVTCYQTDDSGIFLHALIAYPFPMEERLNVPFQAVQIALPEIPDGQRARWVSPLKPVQPNYDTVGEWIIEEIPSPEPAEESPSESPAQA
ncbi:phage tail protein [Herbaspirillum sp. C7C2]|uniref:phage tail protein n=1 Tax=Herbaspirillum sp. C7C2 TaxID=2736666 RepID=UPI001F51807D|nr:phage tail protein [Herbaspirillum sp. C7C2]